MANPFDQFDTSTGGNPFDQFDAAQPEQVPASARPEINARNVYGAAVEPALSLGSSAIATPIAGITGLIAGASEQPTGAEVNAYISRVRAAQQRAGGSGSAGLGATPADVVRNVQDALTYQPRTEGGAYALDKITYPVQKLTEGAQYVGGKILEATGSPAAATAVETLIQAGPLALTRGAARVPARAATVAPKAAPTAAEQAIATATSAGYKLTPSQVGAKTGAAVEGMVGQAALERSLSKRNAFVSDGLARKAIGLPEKAPLTPQSIGVLRKKANRTYAAVAKTGRRTVSDEFRTDVARIDDRTGVESFPADTPASIAKLKEDYSGIKSFNAADAVAKIRQLRAYGNKNMGARNAPEQNALGHAQRKLADALDAELERHIKSIGKPDLVRAYTAARRQLAKIYSVEAALKGGHISAKALAQQRGRGVPLSGELKTIADSYDAFGKVMQDYGKIRHEGPFSVVDYIVGVGGAMHSPPLAAAIAARPAARAFLASDFYQRRAIQSRGAENIPVTPPGNAERVRDLEQRRRAQ